MITSQNINEVVKQLSNKDKKRLKNTNKEYAVLILSIFNTGSVTHLILTNDYNKYKNVSNYGNCILYSDDVVFNDIINN